MATIRPSDLTAASSVGSGDAIIIDDGVTVEKATPAQVVDAAVPLASQAEAETGTDNATRMSPLRTAQAIAAQLPSTVPTINKQTGTSYTLLLTDAQNVVQVTNASPITVTIPPNSSIAFPVGTFIEVHQGGAGAITIEGGSGVTVLSRGSRFETAGEDAVAGVRQVAADIWRIAGDLVA